MPTKHNDVRVTQFINVDQTLSNESTVGHNEANLIKKKLNAYNMGYTRTLHDVNKTIMNLITLNIAVENITGEASSKSILY